MSVVVCIGSGPSLAPEDCALVERSGLYTIAVNSAWKFARFANVIFAGDADWWKHYAQEIDISAERWACCDLYDFGTRHYKSASGWNSGANAVRFSFERKGATTVLLVGYDCSVVNGTHVHGDHPRTRNPDPESTKRWQIHFDRLAHMARRAGVAVINCSRHSELTMFRRVPLADALLELNQPKTSVGV